MPLQSIPCLLYTSDYSGSIFRADELPYALEMVGANRILHGSDMPGAYLVSYGQIMAIPDEEIRKRILWENAAQLFDPEFKVGEPYDDIRLQRVCRDMAVL